MAFTKQMNSFSVNGMLLNSFWLHVLLVFLFLALDIASAQSIVRTLPGYNGTLPFKLETGYVSVGEGEDVQLFYYFIESERNPAKDPLLLWLTGGPGCSALSGLFLEIGPLELDSEAFNGSLPSFLLNQYSWTKVANIIFLDSPVGTGFSYSTTTDGYNSSDSKTAQETYTFLQKWLISHPKFIKNRLYISGDSYAGKMVPIVTMHISKGNEVNVKPRMNLKGYILGNPFSNSEKDQNARIPFAHRLALISDEYFKLAESSCNGEYVNPDNTNKLCLDTLQLIDSCLEDIYKAHILEPKCLMTPEPHGLKQGQAFPGNDDSGEILLPSEGEETPCRDYNYIKLYAWANDPTVREAIHIRKGSKGEWIRCNRSLPYESDVESSVPYHQYLSKKSYEALVYSGDHDMVVPYMSTLNWIRSLNLTAEYGYRPWFVNRQIAGYAEKYKEKEFSLTFATVKGAGHTAPEYKREECLAMIDRWLSGDTL